MSNLTAAGDLLFFTPYVYAYLGGYLEGNELWVTDGTYEGTRMVKDINPGAESSIPEELSWINGKLFFTANLGETWDSEREFYVSEGTAEMTYTIEENTTGFWEESLKELRIYPNPVMNMLNLEFPAHTNVASISIIDQHGRTQYISSEAEASGQALRIDLEAQDLPGGLYTILLITSEGSIRNSSFILLGNRVEFC